MRGRRTGQKRKAPVIYKERSDGYIVVAANAGSDRVPNWFLNLRDAGEALIHIDGKPVRVRARVSEGAEREALLDEFRSMYPAVDDYARYTDRAFPVVLLQPLP